jgi:hypothetical protein
MERFLEKKYFFNNPITLQKSFLKENQVYITSKLDGRRYLVYIHPENSYLIDTSLYKTPLDIKFDKYIKCVLDVEFFKNKYYVFDILSHNNKDTRYMSFEKRYSILKDIIVKLPKKFILKEFKKINTENICDYVRTLKFKLGVSDGIIINGDGNYYSKIFKYKPPETLSIDFRIKKVTGNIFQLYIDGSKGKIKFAETIVTPYQYKKYKNDTVVEFGYFKDKFIPFRERPDKLKSNGLITVKSNYKEILNPSFKC